MSKRREVVLSIEDLTVSFDGFKAVDGLNLYLDRDELRVIIGPNGAGKTTVLDLICGKTRATAGSIKFKDRELLGMQEHKIVRSGIGRKFQTPSIYENLTVFENLEISYPAGHSVFGCLAFSDARLSHGPHRAGRRNGVPQGTIWRRKAHFSATGKSNGWRSACC